MDPAGAIGKLGFRRWYERQLYACHAWLVACLLCAAALLALVEALDLREFSLNTVLVVATACAAGVIAMYSLGRYLSLLMRAQHLSERSTCKRCGTYGRYRLVGATPNSMTVSCRQCNAEWTIE
ncbi:MAG: hypothetical protein OEZ09_13260 [Betaproteobacteria bacterium]|nr:hypothetical protein [Betaproteobacteria bacterium]MDH4326387.1 hypothetical protein [Betaproteobacteria bacterium]MDH5579409.1 hypothetical protein [Betaproteobacteria bacterium]